MCSTQFKSFLLGHNHDKIYLILKLIKDLHFDFVIDLFLGTEKKQFFLSTWSPGNRYLLVLMSFLWVSYGLYSFFGIDNCSDDCYTYCKYTCIYKKKKNTEMTRHIHCPINYVQNLWQKKPIFLISWILSRLEEINPI